MRNCTLYLILSICFSSANVLLAQNFYPLESDKRWTYHYSDFATSDSLRTAYPHARSDHRTVWFYTKAQHQVVGDTMINGKTYQHIAITNLEGNYPMGNEYIRKEGNNYYRINNYIGKNAEILFLKDGLREGDKWITYHGDSAWYTIHRVRTFNKRKMVKGQIFSNVVGITATTVNTKIPLDFTEKVPSPTYYYAENVGLIYTYMPYPLSETYSDREIVLSKDE